MSAALEIQGMMYDVKNSMSDGLAACESIYRICTCI